MRPSGRFLSDLGSEITCLHIVQQLIDRLPRDNAPSLSTFLGHLSGSKARTTQRVYLREISMWLDWCETCGLCVLPAHEFTRVLVLLSCENLESYAINVKCGGGGQRFLLPQKVWPLFVQLGIHSSHSFIHRGRHVLSSASCTPQNISAHFEFAEFP